MKSLSHLLTAIAFCVSAFSFSSCKKIAADAMARTSEYYMKCKINGVQKDFPISAINISDTLIYGLAYGASVAGAPITGTESVGLILYSQVPLNGNMNFNSTYIPGTNLSTGNLNYVNTDGDYSYGSEGMSNSNVQVTISALTATYVKGTFSGKVKEVDNGTVLTISNGEFYAKRQ